MNSDTPRLIEHAFPLKQASLDSVHEKNVRHGHISTLHIWPARRPLAACRAALIATLLPDPGTPEKRRELCEKIGGKVVKKTERKKMPNGKIVEREKEETVGGILHWGRETENAKDLEWFRQEIRKAYGGRAPRVLDPFAGGGAIPLEAMRLGCEATAIDINPVAWFIEKCTLEYPQKLAGKTHPLPDFILNNEEFMEAFYKAHPYYKKPVKTKKQAEKEGLDSIQEDNLDRLGVKEPKVIRADLAWHVRAWGQWVLDQARKELAQYYPTYADFEPLDKKNAKPYEKLPMQLVPLKEDGTADIDKLNGDFSKDYLLDKKNPRWVAKPTVAYLWARTVKCKNCRAEVPLLKTRWLCKKEKKRVLLTMEPNKENSGVVFGIQNDVPQQGGNAAQKREYDKKIGDGTMSKAGATCSCCGMIMTMEDIQQESLAGRNHEIVTAVAMEGFNTKEYRSIQPFENDILVSIKENIQKKIQEYPTFSINELFQPASTRSISAQLYGVQKWADLFLPRQIHSLFCFSKLTHSCYYKMSKLQYENYWQSAIIDLLCLSLDRLLTFMCVNACWKPDADSLNWAFSRFSISIFWDFAENQPLGTSAGAYSRCVNRIATAIERQLPSLENTGIVKVLNESATRICIKDLDLVITDPPYYQAVSYADLSDFSYVWLRGFRPIKTIEFANELSNKTEEIVQHIREDKKREDERRKYEELMAQAFERAYQNLNESGRFVCVFAHKDPIAWETLVCAIIKAGFIVTGSWPIQTEMPSRQRAASAAALSSSVWLVCKKRPPTSPPGWDNLVLSEMRQNITDKLREFWDAGIRGPDFVWAATGPALEAYSKHPVVKKADHPGEILGVTEFLNHVRRMVVEFVVGRVLSGDKSDDTQASADRLDEPTAYYLLHRHDFGMDDAPAGSCILYAVSCGMSDKELADTWDLIAFTKGNAVETDDEEADGEPDSDTETVEESSGSKVKLKVWSQRKGKSLGYEAPGGKPIPLIDRVHRIMHLWQAGDVHKVDEYLDENTLRRHELFKRLLQSLIELSIAGSEERSLLEKISNHIHARGAVAASIETRLDI